MYKPLIKKIIIKQSKKGGHAIYSVHTYLCRHNRGLKQLDYLNIVSDGNHSHFSLMSIVTGHKLAVRGPGHHWPFRTAWSVGEQWRARETRAQVARTAHAHTGWQHITQIPWVRTFITLVGEIIRSSTIAASIHHEQLEVQWIRLDHCQSVLIINECRRKFVRWTTS